ncbi:hypothetical protein [Novosphingobium cyanobacteriorum]|uniref:Uncharacterized protein n=1 Tax=Novosphingobium cyanobacteriorum TaxID=3024215 RepID=A0ABT6CCZ0_9SPHN|nr:hypothetical protein [Novosphingobium cyanobacteriorum]MDF8331795.1 hypothetical protein [Novosphingobium cyanobacteriorum]
MIGLLLAAAAASAQPSQPANSAVDPAKAAAQAAYAAMEGTWSVDLRPSLDDAPYSKPMVLHIAADRSLTGSFYESDILAGRVGTAQGRSCVAFRTTDGNGFYHTSACLVEGKMVGMTWSEGRGFVLPWTATRG